MRRTALVALAVALGACGGDRPQGVEVTEAADSGLPRAPGPRAPSAAFDTVYADTALFVDARADSLAAVRADSLRRDSLRQDSLARAEAARPDFRAFWPRFRTAVAGGRDGVAARTAFSEALPHETFDLLYEVAFEPGPFQERILDPVSYTHLTLPTNREV